MECQMQHHAFAAPELWSVLNNVQDAICTLDDAHRITGCNRALADLTGLPEEALLGKTCCEVIHGSAKPLV